MTATQKQQTAMVKALKSGDLIPAVDHWRNIALMHDTWGLEVMPFYHDDPYRSEWQQGRLSAARQIGHVMRCDAETGMWRQATSEERVDDRQWVCQ
jgi:hypothetical protein